jgi:predicted acetyltransferase
MATKFATYTCPPDALAVGRDAPGRVRRVGPADWERLRTVHETVARERDRDLVLRRGEQWWRERIFRTFDGDERYVYAVERDGAVRGYVAYTVAAGDEGDRLVSYYSDWTDGDARRALLGFLSDHDSQAEAVVLYRPAGSALLDAVDDPGPVDCEVNAGAMVRVVDVVDALETVPYPDDRSETLTLAVADDTAGWNDGQFELSVADGRGECRRVSGADPDANLDVGTLARLLVGFHGVADARQFGELTVPSEDVAGRLAALFPPRTVCSLDNF